MGNKLDPRKFEAWLKRNYWTNPRTNKHEMFMLEVIDEETGQTLLYDTYSVPLHNAQNQNAMQDYAVKAIASKMKLKKEELIDLVRNKEDLDENYINKLRGKMKNNNEKHLEIFEANFNELFKIILTIEFTNKENYFIVESKKFKLKLESTDGDIDNARNEFSDAFLAVIKELINSQRLFHVMSYLGFQHKPYEVIMEEKRQELLNANKKINTMSIDNDKLMKESFVNINRIDPSLNWNSNYQQRA